VKFLEVEESEKNNTQIPNPAYVEWLSRDQTVLGWLLKTLTPQIIVHVISIDSSAAFWAILTTMFNAHSRSRTNQLRGSLQGMKKNEMSTTSSFAKMKGFASVLIAAGKPVEEDEMVGYITNVLDATYNELVPTVNGNVGVTLDDMYAHVWAHD
jgi:hypothetical protein